MVGNGRYLRIAVVHRVIDVRLLSAHLRLSEAASAESGLRRHPPSGARKSRHSDGRRIGEIAHELERAAAELEAARGNDFAVAVAAKRLKRLALQAAATCHRADVCRAASEVVEAAEAIYPSLRTRQ